MLLSLVIEAYDNFIKDGVIQVTLCEDDDNHYNKISVKVISKWLKIDKNRYSILSGETIENFLTVYNVHKYYISFLAKQLNYRLFINSSEVKNNIIEYILERI